MKAVLYCEDNQGVREAIAENLEMRWPQARIITADTLFSALDRAKENKNLELVITDGDLPDGKGWDLASQLRGQGYSGPIIYLGGTNIPDDKEDLFSDICQKGEHESFIATVRKYLGS